MILVIMYVEIGVIVFMGNIIMCFDVTLIDNFQFKIKSVRSKEKCQKLLTNNTYLTITM